MSKSKIIKGTFILTITGLTTKLLGFINRIYLTRIIGIKELGIYQMIFPLYILCISICTQGISTIISKQISFYNGKKQYENATKCFAISTIFSIFLSIFTYIFIFILSKPISIYVLKVTKCQKLITTICISLPFISIKACINSYLVANNKPLYSGLSQLIEQISRILIIYFLSFNSYHNTLDSSLAVTGVLCGEIIATIFSIFIYLYYVILKNKFTSYEKKANNKYNLSFTYLSKNIVHDFIPLTTNNLSLTLFSAAETMFLPSMLNMFYKNSSLSIKLFGTISGIVIPFLLFPATIISSLSTILLPSLSYEYAKGNTEKIYKLFNKIVYFSCFLGVVAWFTYLLFGKSICFFTFKSITAGALLSKMSFICPLIYLSYILTTIENSINKISNAMLFNLISIFIRIFVLIFLVPKLGLNAYILGMAFAYFTLCISLYISINNSLYKKY